MPAARRERCGRVPPRFVALGAALLFLGLTAAAVDDARLRHALPHDSVYAREYMQAMVRDDPAGMWAAYSGQARLDRGGNRAAYLAGMGGAMPVRQGPVNRFRLRAAVPLEGGLTLCYYQVDITTQAGPAHILVPVVIDAAGRVEGAGSDGISFVPPRAASAANP